MMRFTNGHMNETVENLLDIAEDFKANGRTGAWKVMVDATRMIKFHQFQQRQAKLADQRRRRERERNIVLSGPRFSIIDASNESGRRGVSSTNASPDHHFLEGESNG